MTALVIPSNTSFGKMIGQLIANINAVNEEITRLQAAIATAASGYTGTDGTEFEGAGNNFGVVASATPGANGAAFRSAAGTINSAWATFMSTAQGAISELDQGITVQP